MISLFKLLGVSALFAVMAQGGYAAKQMSPDMSPEVEVNAESPEDPLEKPDPPAEQPVPEPEVYEDFHSVDPEGTGAADPEDAQEGEQ